MTEQAFKVGDEVWEDNSCISPELLFVGCVKEITDDGEIVVDCDLGNLHRLQILDSQWGSSPTREAAKAALIAKLEKALDEAKKL